jgi:hypothetical protein
MSDPSTSGDSTFDRFTHFGGLDWAQSEHQLVVVDPHGQIVLSLRFTNDAEGWALFRQKITPLGCLAVAIETNCGPAVERLLDAGLTVYPMNPKAATAKRLRGPKMTRWMPGASPTRCAPTAEAGGPC